MDFSARSLQECFRMLHSLVRQWLHVWRQSMRLFGRISRSLVWFPGDDFGLSPYSELSLVRYWIHALRQSTELVKKLTDFWFVSVFSAELGSTADTCLACLRGFLVVTLFRVVWEMTLVCLRIQSFDSGYMFGVSLRSGRSHYFVWSLGDDFGLSPYSVLSLVRQRIHVRLQSTRFLACPLLCTTCAGWSRQCRIAWRCRTRFLREGGLGPRGPAACALVCGYVAVDKGCAVSLRVWCSCVHCRM